MEDYDNRKEQFFRLSTFFKGDFWDYEDFNENLPDEEFQTVGDRVFSQVELILEDTRMGITKDVYDKKLQDYNDKLQILQIELAEHTKGDFDYKTTIGTVFSVARRAKQIFDSSEPNEKRQLLSYLFQNPTLDKKKFVFTMRSPFNLILKLEYRSTVLVVSR